MIQFKSGDIFESKSQTLVNPVNLQGVMGAGLALDFKQRYPSMFEHYKKVCDDKKFYLGTLLIWRGPEKWVLNFPTKVEWRRSSGLEIIEAGLQKFVQSYQAQKITSIAFPMLGCGYGGLSWETQVMPMMEEYLSDLPIPVELYI